MLRIIFLLIGLLVATTNVAARSTVDMIWVEKAKHQLHLVKDHTIVRSFPIALGRQPYGDKKREGDLRTPEGVYFILGRNDQSRFYLSLYISYPSWKDEKEAMLAGHSPGGQIMIHGEPNDVQERVRMKNASNRDWTDGCIAVSNRDMREIWTLVADGTPILIEP